MVPWRKALEEVENLCRVWIEYMQCEVRFVFRDKLEKGD